MAVLSCVKRFVMLLLVATVTLIQGAHGSTCEEINTRLANDFKLDASQVEVILEILNSKDITDLDGYLTYLRQLPPLTRTYRNLLGQRPKVVFETLVLLATKSPTDLLLRDASEAPLTVEEELAVETILRQVYRNTRWQRFITLMNRHLELLRPSSFLSRAFQFRQKQLDEFSTLEEFLVDFDIKNYQSLANLVRTSRNVDDVVDVFRHKLHRLKQKQTATNVLMRIFLKTEIRKVEAFIALVEQNKEAWRAEAKQIARYVRRGPLEWLTTILHPNWAVRWTRATESLVLSLVVSLASGYAAYHLPEWTNPFVVVYENTPFFTQFPEQPIPIGDEQLQELQNKIKQGTDIEDLF